MSEFRRRGAKPRADGWLAQERGAAREEHASGATTTSAVVDEERFASLSAGDVLDVPRRTASTQTFALDAGDALRWEFRVGSHDLGFSLRRRAMRCGGAVEEDLVAPRRYAAGVAVCGNWDAAEPCRVVAVFDNEYSLFTAKRVAGEMDDLRARLEAARAEARGSALATTDARRRPPDADLLRNARLLRADAEDAFQDGPPAPSTAELLSFLDTYEDANNRPAFGDVRLPNGSLVPGPTITAL
ncbi:hypothetical protein JL721_8306 [Aureococcus anophagefferens]|nr:hypothetical protein JL721_8306 [Aureococcus anophagefferens]